MQTTNRNPAIAIVGVSALFPGSIERNGFWRDILQGKDLISDVPPSHWLIEDYYDPDPTAKDKVYSHRGAFLPPVPFDPLEFGILPNAVAATDSAQLLALLTAKQVLDDAANGQFETLDRERISVILGVASATELVCSMSSRMQRPIWTKALRESGLAESEVQAICERIAGHYVPWQENTFPGLLGNVVAGRIANRLDLGGTNCVVDAACASSLAALAIGLDELRLGHSDLVISGGVDALNDILMFACFSKTTALSPSGDCRPFADRADGTVLGEGLGMFALRRLADAERDGNSIYAVIKGLGRASDGRAKSIYAPCPDGQARALSRAYEQAGYGPETVGLVEAHGTATKAGDVAEFAGLTQVFQSKGRPPWCALGSIKSQIGHTKAAAGAAGLFKAVMALHHKVLPPTIKVERPNPALEIERSAFYLNTQARPWIGNRDHPRRAAVSSFGFGGTDYHITMEEYTGPGKHTGRLRTLLWELILLSADSASVLITRCADSSQRLAKLGGIAGLAWHSQETFDPQAAVRLALVVDGEADLKHKLAQATERIGQHPQSDFSLPIGIDYAATVTQTSKLAFLFPGQGSQYLNMGIDIALHFDAARAVWEQDPNDLHEIVFPPPAFTPEQQQAQTGNLTAMANAQPAIAALSLSQLALLQAAGVQPDCVAGHSFGEVTALHAAGCFDATTMLQLARRRGELMTAAAQTSAQAGAMLAVAAPRDTVTSRLDEWGLNPVLIIANYNAPRQMVLSGAVAAIDEAERAFTGNGVGCRRLKVASAFHSPIVSASSLPLAEFLATLTIHSPVLPVYANSTAAPYPLPADAVRRQLAEQLSQPVRFLEQIDAMYEAGVRCFVEVGPNNVLSGLVGQCLQDRPHQTIALDRKGQNGLFGLWMALGRLALSGLALEFAPLWADFDPPQASPQPGPHMLMISGANYAKPYPPKEGAAALPKPNPEIEKIEKEDTDTMNRSGIAIEAFHHQIAEVQSHFQQTMTASHQSYLNMVSKALGGIAAGETGVAQPGEQMQVMTTAPIDFAHKNEDESAMAPAPALPSSPATIITEAVAVEPPPPPPDSNTSETDFGAVLLDLVAEKTGYPAEMLELDMELEANLGIDSIKRVEILAALKERMPHLPEVDTGALAELKTLVQIVEFMQGPSHNHPATSIRLERTAVRRIATPNPGVTLPGLRQAQQIIITPDGGGVAEALAAEFSAKGQPATVTNRVPATADAVICLDGLRQDGGPEHSLATHFSVFQAARSVAETYTAGGGVFVTVHDSGGDFGLSGDIDRAWLAGLPGVAKTAQLEWPQSNVKAIDLERGGRDAQTLAVAILAELFNGGEELEVGLRADGQRNTLCCQPEPLGTTKDNTIDAESVFVVSGGARGVTAVALEALARAYRPRLLLLGRTELHAEPACCQDIADEADLKQALLAAVQHDGRALTPAELGCKAGQILAAREVRATLQRLQQAGSVVRYASVDIGDAPAVAVAVDSARQEWGTITGLIHAAGVLADKRIQDKSDAQFERVFRTKVDGLQALLAATAADPLKLITLFGSVAGRYGNVGQCDYAAANEVLNRVALAEAACRDATCLVKALNWGPWDGGMVTPALRQHFTQQGIALIPLQAGAEYLVKELTHVGTNPVELVIGMGNTLTA